MAFVSFTILSAALPANSAEQLGKVNFLTFCDPKVQAELERGVAVLHSCWFSYARKTFEAVLQQASRCATIGASN